ncbi:MAG: hypothetical protein GWP04_11135 [Gammaproteobacteria bacterium]|nr:hypothetical protein [Gammaproteobacteria bacterium]
MTKDEFDHAIRAAGAVLGVSEVLVIGSQAVHGSVPGDLPEEALRSVEVDVAVFGDVDGAKADLLDGSIGEASIFHESFGFYAQGVVETTAVLPEGWRERLVRYESPGTGGVVAWCLELHDLWVSKAVAGRPKDIEFCRAFLDQGTVRARVLHRRLAATVGLDDAVQDHVRRLIGPTKD